LKHEEKGIITNAMSGSGIDTGASGTYTIVQSGSTTDAEVAAKDINLSNYSSNNDILGKGITVNGKTIEFYDASKGAYAGNNIGVNISQVTTSTLLADAIVKQASGKLDGVALSSTGSTLRVSSTVAGAAGNNISVSDGSGADSNFAATFQVGANKGQSFSIEIKDMRAYALGIASTAGSSGFTNSKSVTNGTDNVSQEAGLDVSTHANASNALKIIDAAIEKVSAQRSSLGAFTNRLEHTINNLTVSSENLQSAESRIRDVDMAKEMMEFTKNNILSQAAQAMLAQANQQPQGVLQLLK
jgi:flagellin